jgi:hypothetical protein
MRSSTLFVLVIVAILQMYGDGLLEAIHVKLFGMEPWEVFAWAYEFAMKLLGLPDGRGLLGGPF